MPKPKRQYADQLAEHQQIKDRFLVVQKSLALSRANQPYLRVTLSDRSGTVEARVWDGAEELEGTFRRGEVVQVTGRVTLYQGTPQINVDAVERLSEKDLAGVAWDEFLPAAKRPRDEMWRELVAALSAVENRYLRSLLDAFFADEGFREAFMNAPAARGIHHVYLGGLLEHTLAVVQLARTVGALYPLNQDLLLAGAFLHDVGKVEELSYRAGFDYTDEGRLLGHIVLGAQMVRDRAADIPGFPKALLVHLEHLLLSHHGENEWGSPKRPKTLEAFALHALDNLDAKVSGARQWMEKQEGVEGDWTGYWKTLGRALYRLPLSGPRFGEGPEGTVEDLEAEFLRAEAREAERGHDGATAEGRDPREEDRPRDAAPRSQGELGF